MTGLNFGLSPGSTKQISWEQTSKLEKAEIYEYCRNHPMDSYMRAAFQFFEKLPDAPYKSDQK